MKKRYYWLTVLVMAVVLLMLAGCAKQSGERTVDLQGVVLPDWAPQNPSPEFVRAARVIKPFRREASTDLAAQAEQMRHNAILVPAWEFFGSLSDEQIDRIMQTKSLRLPHRSLTKKQQKALDNFFEIWRQVMKDAPPDGEWETDALAELYRLGARQDLSNVDFIIDMPVHIVRFMFMIRGEGGQTVGPHPLTGLGTL